MNNPPNFQSMINALQMYWDSQGCLIWQPYYAQVGAGTMNPATFLRVLGPEPWRVGYVEPSVRPDDGRYGYNPNRLQMHYQYQVILKPDPGDPQEMYLRSLEAMGINVQHHDIRFVEDNWESPALGAWGLGWEVWLDGLEITQFTYFQQAGKLELDPVSVEITYGLDRIAAPLQGVRNFKDIQWDSRLTFGDVNLQGEYEHSKYYFEVADVERTRALYELNQGELENALQAGLVLPAYDHLLKLSHLFNVMDTRGAIGVTERAQFFRSMRNLAGRVAEVYVAERQKLGFPWLEAGSQQQQQVVAVKASAADKPADLLLEIGTEEIPPGDMNDYLAQLEQLVPALLDEQCLGHKSIKIMGTPRRLVVYVEMLEPRQPDRQEVHKGPPAERAYDADGKPTKAAEGFARGKGIRTEQLQVQQIDGGQYVAAVVTEKGRPAVEVLAEHLPALIASLKVERTMRWNSSNVAFSRPIRWLLALYGQHTIPFQYAGLTAGDTSRGLRFSQPETQPIKDPAAYFKFIQSQGIILDVAERKAGILVQLNELAAGVGGQVPDDPALLDEVTHLVEAPAVLRGEFEQEHLQLPKEVLVTVMKKHQRYFPVQKGEKLLPFFIAVANEEKQDMDLIAKGNQDVVRARFVDAAYFIQDDLKHKLEAYVPKLNRLTFQAELGSMLDKTRRITQLVPQVGKLLGIKGEELKTAMRAAELCKADLATSMVVEMTSLQGIMGQQYAERSGETPQVCQAIYQHYLPRFAGDHNPGSPAGLLVGLADRLDSLAGLFAAGLAPTGAKDPYALRRAALGLIQLLTAAKLEFDLQQGLKTAAQHLPIKASTQQLDECLSFIIERQRHQLLEEGFVYDVVDAVLGAQGHNPNGVYQAVKQLSQWVKRPDWNKVLDNYSRCVRITRDLDKSYPVAASLLVEKEEKTLFSALDKAEKTQRSPGSVDDFLNAFLPLIPAVETFFDEVLVMTEDEKLQHNRLGLLQRIAALAEGVADMSRLEGF